MLVAAVAPVNREASRASPELVAPLWPTLLAPRQAQRAVQRVAGQVVDDAEPVVRARVGTRDLEVDLFDAGDVDPAAHLRDGDSFGVALLDRSVHTLRDLTHSEHVFEMVADALAARPEALRTAGPPATRDRIRIAEDDAEETAAERSDAEPAAAGAASGDDLRAALLAVVRKEAEAE